MKLVLILVISVPAFAADLQQQLEAIAREHHGKVALYAKHLKTGATVAINADTQLKTASVIKLPIMIEAFAQAKAGRVRLDDKLTVTKDNQVAGSGILTFLHPGLEITLEDAVVLMMDLSDNSATNMVIDKISLSAVNRRLAAMGMKNTYLYKKVFKPAEGPMPDDQKKFGLGKTTAREMGEIMAAIERCDLPAVAADSPAPDRAQCNRMIKIMKEQQGDRTMVPRYLQTDDTSERPSAIADKIGALDEVRNDVAIVYTGGGPIVISAFTWENEDKRWNCENEGARTIAHLAQVIMAAWAPRGVQATPAK